MTASHSWTNFREHLTFLLHVIPAYRLTMALSSEAILSTAKQFVQFINKSPSPFHAVNEVKKRLLAAGFTELREADHWNVKPLDKCFLTRNHSTIIAFAVGGKFKPGNGFSIVGAHTDSPCLKVKPDSKKVRNGFVQIGVECYGGGIWRTWMDRDLTVAGRVLVRNGSQIDHRLVHIERPLLKIPNLAIHLDRSTNDSFGPNKENHLIPILATTIQAELQGGENKSSSSADGKTQSDGKILQAEKHPAALIKLLCEQLEVKPEQILDFELCLADTQPAAIGGVYNEFLFSPRLDNLLNAYAASEALVESLEDNSLENDPNIRLICLFDNEEVGSQSAQGAGSTLQELVLRRLSAGELTTAFEESIPKSFMISADQAHALHPNFTEKHESNHQPAFHKGVVIKFNANQKYASTAITATILRLVAEQGDVPLQDFVVRNDSACGSTIGPIMSAKLGIPTIDVGAPQMAMHSIRETGCTSGLAQSKELFKVFFQKFPSVFQSLSF